MIFQAMGVRYTFRSALRHLVKRGTQADHDALRRELGSRYGGEAILYSKNRSGLSEAIRLASGGTGEVIVSGLTCYSVIQAVEAAGCSVRYVDIDPESLQPELAQLETIDAKNARVLVVQHMLGIPVEIDPIMEWANTHSITVIEDLAHSAGAQYADGREVGTVGAYTVLSFGKDKALDVVNGGALIVRQGEAPAQPTHTVSRALQRRDRWYPMIAWISRILYPVLIGRYLMAIAIRLGWVIRSSDGDVAPEQTMTQWQAALALPQVRALDETAHQRRARAQQYRALLTHRLPGAIQREGAAPLRMPLCVKNRDAVIASLATHGIVVPDVWYDVPVGPARYYPLVTFPDAECPRAVEIAASLLNLPTHERMSQKDIEKVAQYVNEVAAQ